MKLSFLIVLVSYIQVSAHVKGQEVFSINMSHVSINKVLDKIQKESDYRFFYNDKYLRHLNPVHLDIRNATLPEVMEQLLDSTLSYKIIDKNLVVISPKENLFFQHKIQGVVTDEKGNPLAGVTIKVKGSTTGTVTDAEGRFSLVVPEDATLEVSFVGFTTKNIEVGSQTDFTIQLKTSSTGLNQLVVVGYSTQSKRNITGAVDQISGEEISSIPMTNINQGLQGMSPNVNIDILDGKPFAKPTINIRGATSIGEGGSALVLIDGVEGDPSMLNPNDIKSISVLKGPAASAEYGARAAFGVVQITTKDGVNKGFSLNFGARVGFKQPAVEPDFVTDGYTYVKNFYKAYQNGVGIVPKNINKTQPFSLEYLEEFKKHHDDPSLPDVVVNDQGDYVYYASTDWYHKLYKDWLTDQVYDFSASAGSDQASFILSGRYEKQGGLIRYNSDNYNMYNLRGKGRVKLLPWLTLKNNFHFARRSYFNPLNVGEGGGIWRNIQDEGHPSAPMLNPDGTITFSGVYTVGDLYYGKNGKDFKNQVAGDKIQLEGDFFEHKLRLTGNFSFENTRNDVSEKRVPVPYSTGPGNVSYVGQNQNWLRLTTTNTNYYALNLYAEYENTFAGKHNIDFTVGSNYESQIHDSTELQRNGLAFANANNINLALGEGISTAGGYFRWNIFGIFYQLNYNYDHRYLLTLSGRYDGNSKFPKDQRFGFFPSFAAGWVISQEPYWNVSRNVISELKIRASYGSLGNGNITPYTYQQELPIKKSSRIINGEQPQTISNPPVLPEGLTWETVTTSDVGLDLSLLSDRLTFSGDYYIRNTSNMFTQALVPPRVFGAVTPKGNYADLRTTGWGLTVSWADQINNVAGKKLNYKIGLNLSDNKAKITRFNNPDNILGSGNYYVGEMLDEIWGYVTEGIFQTEEQVEKHANQDKFLDPHTPDGKFGVGNLAYKDLNGDGVINDGDNTVDNPGDRRIIGNNHPRYRFGANINLNWNNFSLSAFFQGVGKRDWYPSSEGDYFWGQYNRPYNLIPKWQLKPGVIWSPDNPDAFLPKYVGYEAQSANDLGQAQTRYLMNVAYIRLKNVQLGYNFGTGVLSKIGIKKAEVYISGQNLWLYTPLHKIAPNIDPENGIAKSESDVSGGTAGDGLNYPILKSVIVGVSFNF